MFERFTDRARRVVMLAQEEARLLNHHQIGTEHLLLGLIDERDGLAARALVELGISLEEIRIEVDGVIDRGSEAPSEHLPFTPQAKQVLELSMREGLQLGHNYIGTEHLLLGLIRQGDGLAAQVLLAAGADLSRARQQVIQLLSGLTGARSTPGYEAAALLRRWPDGPLFSELLQAGEDMRALTLEALVACWDGDMVGLEARLGDVVRLAALAGDDAQLTRLAHVVAIDDALQGVVRLRPRTPPT